MSQKYLKIFGVAAVVILILVGLFFFKNGPTSPEPVAANGPVSGTVTFTALKPDPEDADKGTVVIKYKNYNSKDDYQSTGITLPVENNAKWTWDDAVAGESYEFISVLMIGSKEIKESEPVTATAPAENVTLALHVDWDDLPSDLIDKATTNVTGTAIINGFIPSGSILTISAKEATAQNFVTTQTFNSPAATQSWVWKNAVKGTDYNVKADLTLNGTLIGTTGSLNAIAGDNAVTMILTSRATPPAPSTTTISGNVYINGPINNNSTLIITAQQSGTGSTTQIAQVNNPTNSQNWQWNGAQTGQSYQIIATLQVNGNNSAQARSTTVTAPASNVNFTINTGVSIPTPTAQPSLVSCNQVSSNTFNATLQWPNQSNAGNYWFQVGTNPGQSDTINQKVSANNSQGQRTSFDVQGSKNYYAQWAYSLCVNCSSDSNFSNFSTPPMRFYCGGNPNPTPTPTQAPSPSPTPLPSPTPVPSPKISQCGQSCGSNGYSCAQGLSCTNVPGGMPGSQTCQNQSCPGEPDCICPLQ